ncbi:uncharacterized protein LOC123880223 isoform X2 [Maniola jurtina]|uniref:uncharacterized protein LOC123880223 isoform X2 n=1 Tax=Maniola jurtina TaxID=191418 RepID=UPI001E687DFB|nr:uncharacterized protein LOC123880223 isoform X2 [Maniola jurtina]
MSFSGCLLCLNVILFHCRVAIGERTKLPRYAFDPNFKPQPSSTSSPDDIYRKYVGITESKPFNLLRSQLSRNSSNL